MARSLQIHERTTIVATEAITAKRIVAADGTHTVKKGIGVAEYDAALGAPITVITRGVVEVLSGAAVAAGLPVMSDADGKAVPLVTSGIDPLLFISCLGVAIDAATDTGQYIRINLGQCFVEGTKPGT